MRYILPVFLLVLTFGETSGQTVIDTVLTRTDITSYVMTETKIEYAVLGNGNNKEYSSHIEGENMLMIKPNISDAPVLNLLIRETSGKTHYLVVAYDRNLDIRRAFYDLSKEKPVPVSPAQSQIAEKEKADSAKTIKETVDLLMESKVNYRSYADRGGRIILAMTDVESKDGYFFIKFEVNNGSSIAYTPKSHSINYVDRAGRGIDRSSIELEMKYTNIPQTIEPNTQATYVVVVQQFGITEIGYFDYYMEENGGRRDLHIKLPAKLLIR